jgi:MFS family permease
VTRVVTEADLDANRLARLLTPRHGVVRETPSGDPHVFVADEGPVERYRRSVTVEERADGRCHVVQTVDYRLAFPYFRFLFALPMRKELRRIDARPAGTRMPWWHPPDRLDARASSVLAVLALVSIVTGYMGTILTETITYAAAEFGSSRRQQGFALASVRADVVLSLLLVSMADRRGRRPLLLMTTGLGCALTALGALAPSLPFLAGSQVLARGCVTASAVIIAIVAAEEMPSSSRAYAVSLLAMSAGLGSGFAVMALPLASLGEKGWRLVFLLAVLGLPLLLSIGRNLPETLRFAAHQPAAASTGRRERAHGGRLALLAVSALLLSLFVAPAAQFQNEFLRTERGYSAALISMFTLFTNTPAGIGIVVGGRLADVRGRRLIGAIGTVLGTGATVAMYLTHSWSMWAWSVFGAVTGAAVIPALGVYGPELFPTGARGSANGWITAAGRIGSVVGLVLVGALSTSLDKIGPAMAVCALGPLVLAVLILVAYPETAHLALEELNPEDGL